MGTTKYLAPVILEQAKGIPWVVKVKGVKDI